MIRGWLTMGLALSMSGVVGLAAEVTPRTRALLEKGDEPVRIVGFGDSITGVYYHTGGYRAWPELLDIALSTAYPKADVTVFNAGVSGNTTDAGLKRMQRDVLDRRPHAVVIMFGMNDLAYGAVDEATDRARKEQFRNNLTSMVTQCRGIGAEVVLLTPNPVYPEASPKRPPERVGDFAAVVRDVSEALDVPLVDNYAEWSRLRREDPRRWRLLMSETIHPSLAGHRLFAERTASAMAGKSVSLDGVGPWRPCLQHTCAALKADAKSVTVVVPEALVADVTQAIESAVPGAAVETVPWPVVGRSLKEIEAWSKRIRGLKGNVLVIGSFSPESAVIGDDEEAFVRQASWVVNYALPFGRRTWDVLFVSPACLGAAATPAQEEGLELMRSAVEGHDLVWAGPGGSVDVADRAAFQRWLTEALSAR